MRKYETVFISDPDLNDQNRQDLFEKVRDIITKGKGIILDLDEWGNKKLAYEIKKKTRGYYVCVTYGGTGDLVNELERNFRLNESIMKFMTIVLSEDMTVQQIEDEVQQAQQEEAATEEPAAPEAEAAPEADTDTTKEEG